MSEPRPGRCSVCKAPVLRTVTEYGAVIDLDRESDPEGAFVLEEGVAVTLPLQTFFATPKETRYMDHRQTCATPGVFRKRKP